MSKKFTKDGDYKVITPEDEYVNGKYAMLVDYNHQGWLCGNSPDLGSAHPSLKNVRFRIDGMTLLKGYEWNGSDIVTDSPECMRASAVHDAWCDAMEDGIYKYTKANWDMGADEYADICIEDGLDKEEANCRRSYIKSVGPPKRKR